MDGFSGWAQTWLLEHAEGPAESRTGKNRRVGWTALWRSPGFDLSPSNPPVVEQVLRWRKDLPTGVTLFLGEDYFNPAHGGDALRTDALRTDALQTGERLTEAESHLVATHIELWLLRADSPLEAVRFVGTNGGEGGPTRRQVLEELERWQVQYGFDPDVYCATEDSLNFRFRTPPTDLHRLADQMFHFCPDSVPSGVEDTWGMTDYLETHQAGFFELWWDA